MRSSRRRHVLVLLAIAVSLAVAAPVRASGGGGAAVISDCVKHLSLTRSYPASALEDALRTMSAQTAEYTNCRDVIQRALLAALGKGHVGALSGSSSGGSFLPTPLLVVLILLALAALTLGAVAVRRRRVK